MKMKTIKEKVEEAATFFESCYLDWLNDFLTIAGYADYYGLTLEKAKMRISIGRKVHYQRHGIA